MAGGYRVVPLTPDETARWDELVLGYGTSELFHQNVWLDYLAASRGIDVAKWAIRSDRGTVGYFCGGILDKGPFRILGSPLRSWGTNSMGPITDPDADQDQLVAAVEDLAQAERLAMIELEHPLLPEATLGRAGFERVRDWTYLVALDPGRPDAMWRALESECRNRIRKAMSAGVTVEDADDPAVVDEFYDLYVDLLRRRGRTPSFLRDTPRHLFSHLKKADCLFALRAKDPAGRVLSIGLFPHDAKTMYFWSGASREDGHPLCPNDYLQWTAMGLAASRGLTRYNTSGHGRFKRKFGGTLVELARWHKCYWRTARWARHGYQAWFARFGARALWHPHPGRPATIEARSRSRPRTAPVEIVTTAQRPSFRLSDIARAPLHDLPIRDEILYQYLPLAKTMDVLEIGPGSGVTAFRLAREVRSLTLLDIAPANISHLRAVLGMRDNLDFVCADVCAAGLPERLGRTFDAVYAIEVFELLPDPETCLKNLASVLRPGGHLLLQFPNYPPALSPGLTHFRTKAELGRLLHRAGFSSWRVCALKLRPYASFLYRHFHERPIDAYRRRRAQKGWSRPLIYDDSWAFQHGPRLEPFKYLLHIAWAGLARAMRLGGPVFVHAPLGNEILNSNLVLLARREADREGRVSA
jgi:SAM-dependent methyltransferase